MKCRLWELPKIANRRLVCSALRSGFPPGCQRCCRQAFKGSPQQTVWTREISFLQVRRGIRGAGQRYTQTPLWSACYVTAQTLSLPTGNLWQRQAEYNESKNASGYLVAKFFFCYTAALFGLCVLGVLFQFSTISAGVTCLL